MNILRTASLGSNFTGSYIKKGVKSFTLFNTYFENTGSNQPLPQRKNVMWSRVRK